MARTLIGLAVFLLAIAAGAVWYTVSTDRWPLDERQPPASLVWAFNAGLGKFLYEHGQDTAEEVAARKPRRETITAQEQADIRKALDGDPRFKDRIVTSGGGFSGGAGGGFKLKPALPVGGGRRG